MRTPLFTRPLSLVVLAGLLMAPEGGFASGAGGAPSLPVVEIICADAPPNESREGLHWGLHGALCSALADVLGESGKLARVSIEPEALPRDGRITLRVILGAVDDQGVSAALSWQEGRNPPQVGPMLEMSVMDTALSPAMLRDFAAELTRLTELPL